MGLGSWLKKMRNQSKHDNFYWDFKTLTPYDFELLLRYSVRDRLIKDMFDKCYLGVCKKVRTSPDNPDIEEINEFEVDNRYIKLLNTVVKKHVKIVEEDIGTDGFEVLSFNVTRAKFQRKECRTDWMIHMVINGRYHRKEVEA